jgi:hypothetical protein
MMFSRGPRPLSFSLLLLTGVCFRSCISTGVFFLLLQVLAICCGAEELNQRTVEAFDRYIRVTDARVDAELRRGGPFLWIDALPQPRRQRLYDLLQHGQLEIRKENMEEEGKPIEVPDGLIHHWTGIAFVPGVSLERVLSLLQDYDNHCRTYKPEVRRSKLLEHSDDTFKIYLQFYRDSPRRISFNTEFDVHYTRIDATHVISRAVSARIAELQRPEQPDSPEFPLGKEHGYLWRLDNYWRLEEKDGGVYMQVESIALSRDVPTIFAWLINPLIRRVSRQSLASLLYATRRGLLSSSTGSRRTQEFNPRQCSRKMSGRERTIAELSCPFFPFTSNGQRRRLGASAPSLSASHIGRPCLPR